MTRQHLPDMNPRVVRRRYVADHDRPLSVYLIVHFLATVALGAIAMQLHSRGAIGEPLFWALGGAVFWTLWCQGNMLDGSAGARTSEKLRTVRVCVVCVCMYAGVCARDDGDGGVLRRWR